jgi:hypothetical protein
MCQELQIKILIFIVIYRVSRVTTADMSYLEELSQKRNLDLTVKDLQCISHVL